MRIDAPKACLNKFRLTINEIIDEWLYECKNQLKISSYQKYRTIIINHISEKIGKLPLSCVTSRVITMFADSLLSENLSKKQSISFLLCRE